MLVLTLKRPQRGKEQISPPPPPSPTRGCYSCVPHDARDRALCRFVFVASRQGSREATERVVDPVPELHHAPLLPARAFPPDRRPSRPRGAGPRHHEAHGGAAKHGKVRQLAQWPRPPRRPSRTSECMRSLFMYPCTVVVPPQFTSENTHVELQRYTTSQSFKKSCPNLNIVASRCFTNERCSGYYRPFTRVGEKRKKIGMLTPPPPFPSQIRGGADEGG